MFFSVGFTQNGLPLGVHAEWDPQILESCSLHMYSSQEQARKVLATAREGREELLAVFKTLPETTSEDAVHITGAGASTIGAMIVSLLNDGVEIQTFSDNSDLSGFWEPTRSDDAGILVWVDPEVKYHVALVYNKAQVRSVVRSLADWMGGVRRGQLLKRINQWPVPETSVTPIQTIEGNSAELIHWSSLYSKIKGSLRRQAN
jgi:hypothetical protein